MKKDFQNNGKRFNMETHSGQVEMTPEEKKFREYLTRGDDFCKIELYRHAVHWYREAVKLRPDDTEARARLDGCSGKIHAESRTILIIVAVAACVIVLGMILF